jgi:serine/threonine protein kinase
MAQLLNGFRSMNSQNITHRDFKPGNILVSNGVLKIADFGNSKPVFEKSELMNEYVGTLCTAAPQIRFQ